jgi:DNA-binding NtrC family response regulator
MQSYAWPGNIRELRNAMDRAVLLCEGDSIKPEHLPAEKMASVMSPENNVFEESQANHFDPEFNEDTAQIDLSASKLPLQTPKLTGDQTEIEYRQIIDALFRAGGNQTMAADIMGIPRRTFVRRLEAYDIPRPRKAEKEAKKTKKSKKD